MGKHAGQDKTQNLTYEFFQIHSRLGPGETMSRQARHFQNGTLSENNTETAREDAAVATDNAQPCKTHIS